LSASGACAGCDMPAHEHDDAYCDWCGKDMPIGKLHECGEYLVCSHCAQADEDEREAAAMKRSGWDLLIELRGF
jgi:hypothetical protein